MSSKVRVAVAQINCTVGDFEGNSRKIIDAASRAAAAGGDLLLTPELSLSGYPPEDLLLRRAFYAASDAALQMLATQLLEFRELSVIVGHPLAREGNRFNAASLLQGGVVLGTYCKHDLPNYDVFDEQRYFTPDNRPLVFELNGTSFGINICEDTWFPYTPECARAAGAEVLLVLNGSPFNLGKQQLRIDTQRANVSRYRMPVVYCNLVGGQDELGFDGGSFVLDAAGELVAAAAHFRESVLMIDFIDGAPQLSEIATPQSDEALVYSALVLGVRDYLGKNGFPGAIIGLSGGVDSALTLAVAVDALGPERVRASVSAELDFTQTEQTRESFDPNVQMVRSEQTSEDSRRGDGVQGVPGALSNQPPEIAAATAGGAAAANRARPESRLHARRRVDRVHRDHDPGIAHLSHSRGWRWTHVGRRRPERGESSGGVARWGLRRLRDDGRQ